MERPDLFVFSVPYMDVPCCASPKLIRFAAIYPASLVGLMAHAMMSSASRFLITTPVFTTSAHFRLRPRLPFLVMDERLLFPPELRCLGTRPLQADNCRPLENCSAFTSLRKAAAISEPIPGIVISILYLGCCWNRSARQCSVGRMRSLSKCMFSSNENSNWRSTWEINCSASSIISSNRCCKI